MQRRKFLAGLTAASLAAALPLRAEEPKTMSSDLKPLERRRLGRTGEQLSMIGFGGIIVMNETAQDAANYVAQAFDRGVNYFDIAPSYGNAQEMLGPALEPYRERVFLACKTEQREGPAAREALELALKQMRTDRFDLYQLHAITTVEEVQQIFAPGGVMEVLLKAREEGKIRYLGFSAHSHAAANFALDHHDFDTVLFPFSYLTWTREDFGPEVLKRCRERDMGLLALKAMAKAKWPADLPEADRRWPKTWYEPYDTPELAALGLRYTLNLGVTAALPPGQWDLLKLALDLAQTGKLGGPLDAAELETLAAATRAGVPIFESPKVA